MAMTYYRSDAKGHSKYHIHDEATLIIKRRVSCLGDTRERIGCAAEAISIVRVMCGANEGHLGPQLD